MAVFWVTASFKLVQVHQRFRDPYCLHHQGDESDLVSYWLPGPCPILTSFPTGPAKALPHRPDDGGSPDL
jgi:hypothetical protein